MQYTVLGFNQTGLQEAGCDMTDAAILRFVADFIGTGQMKSKIIAGEPWYWLKYGHLIDEMPILGLTGETLRRRMVRLELAGLLRRHVVRDRTGTWMYVRPGAKLAALQTSTPTPTNVVPPPPQKVDPSPTDVGVKDPSTSIPLPADQKRDPLNGHRAHFDEWYLVYPRHVGKKAAARAYASAVREATPEQLLEGARRERSKGAPQKFTPHPATWLNQGRWDDEDDAVPVVGHEAWRDL